eukprot:TRINITY_DN18598_c0_g1_i7.p1 TRINITY_DN18598_c0_g1~~TRINITY_DN18598_c0_g1_i7.p1  ORF type:complete len:286 (+),score=3.95 TRINITY_DN18598_c0_g1_i7:64-921(+)
MEPVVLFDYSAQLAADGLWQFDDKLTVEQHGHDFQYCELTGFVLYTQKLTDTRYSVLANIRKFTVSNGTVVLSQPLGDRQVTKNERYPLKHVGLGHLPLQEGQGQGQKSHKELEQENIEGQRQGRLVYKQGQRELSQGWVTQIGVALQGYTNRLFCSHLSCTINENMESDKTSKQLAYGDRVRDTQYAFELRVKKGLHVKGFYGLSTRFGEVCKLGVYVAPIAPLQWSPDVHKEFPYNFQVQVREMVKIWRCGRVGGFDRVPEYAMYHIFQKLNELLFQSYLHDQ